MKDGRSYQDKVYYISREDADALRNDAKKSVCPTVSLWYSPRSDYYEIHIPVTDAQEMMLVHGWYNMTLSSYQADKARIIQEEIAYETMTTRERKRIRDRVIEILDRRPE